MFCVDVSALEVHDSIRVAAFRVCMIAVNDNSGKCNGWGKVT